MLTALTALWDDKETVWEEKQRAQRAAGRQTHSSWMGFVKWLHLPQWAAGSGACCRRWSCLWRGSMACVIHPTMDGNAAHFLLASCDLRNDLIRSGHQLWPSTLATSHLGASTERSLLYGRTILQATYSLLSARLAYMPPWLCRSAPRKPAESTYQRDRKFSPPRRAFSCLNGNLISISEMPSLVEQWLVWFVTSFPLENGRGFW